MKYFSVVNQMKMMAISEESWERAFRVGSISAAPSGPAFLPEKISGSFPEQRLVIEPTIRVAKKMFEIANLLPEGGCI